MTAQRHTYESALADGTIDRILKRMAEGASLTTICRDEDMPSRSAFMSWVAKHPELTHRYEQACNWRADLYVDEVVDIADDSRADRLPDGTWDTEHIQRARLRVDTRKWVAAKMHPRRYGERVTQEHVGKGGGPILVQAVDLSDDELAAIALRSGQ